MKIEFLNKRNPYHVLGVPSFAKPGLIRSAYRKRLKVLQPYRFDKAAQPLEWKIVNDVLRELNEAYAQVSSSDQSRDGHPEAAAASRGKPGPAENDNGAHAPVSMGNRYDNGNRVGGEQITRRAPFVKSNNGDGDTSTLLSSESCPSSEFERLWEWVRLGACHVRKNVACIEEHRQRLLARGETKVRLSELDQWRSSPVFNEREKAALNLCQAISLHEPEEQWIHTLQDARIHFSTHQIVRLTLAITGVNDWIDFHANSPDRILVVDDNPWDQENLFHHLRKTQMAENVLFVSNGSEALELIEDSRRSEWGFVAIFLHLHLADMNGLQLLQRIRTMTGMEDIPVIVMTSFKNLREMQECKRLKVTSYVEKPVTFSSYSRAVSNIFSRNKYVHA